MIIEAAAVSVLFMDQTIESNIKGLTVEQTLSLSQTIECNIIPQQLSSFLNLQQLALCGKTISRALGNTLTMITEAQPRVSVIEVEQALLAWSDIANETQWPLVTQTLVMTQSAVCVASKHTHSELVLSQTVTVSVTYSREVVQEVPIISEATAYLPKHCWYAYEFEVIAP